MSLGKRAMVTFARGAFRSVYECEYMKLRGVARGDIAPWIAPIAAARLSEGITEENDALVALVEDNQVY